MKFVADINIMPHKELLDPQGKAVANNLKNVGITGVLDVRIGKHISLNVEAESEAAARELVDTACRKLLANVIMESFHFELREAEA
jgi:phosphoribosylformylglycinamidine synthase subunit PurS